MKMNSITEMKKVVRLNENFKRARQNFLNAKSNFLNKSANDMTSDDATEAMEILFDARDNMIEAAVQMAEAAPRAILHVNELLTLREKARKSPAIRERLVNAILEIELK
jgi:hypothetical protein